MNKLIKNIIKYQESKEEYLFNNIIKDINYIIKKHLNKVDSNYKEDIYQEILMSIYKVINKFKIKTLNNDLTYLNNFIDKYQIKNNLQIDLLYEYNLFCNENQFRKYIDKTCLFIKCKYIRDNEKHLNKVSLNTIVEENIELIDLVKDNQKLFANINVLEDILKKEEIDFISSFIEGGRILTQKEVASKLGISQQLVSYRFNKIKKKLINKKNF